MKKPNDGTKKNNKALNVIQFFRKFIDRRPEASRNLDQSWNSPRNESTFLMTVGFSLFDLFFFSL